MTGTTLTHYRITAKLGEGGMGVVYRASDTKLGREVTIKVLPARISRDATSLARFEREAKALAALNHPHIASIYGFDAERETQDPKLVGPGRQIPAEIRQKLGPLQNLEVVNSPTRVEQLLQHKKSEAEIARELGVDGLVMGELHGQGETMSAYV